MKNVWLLLVFLVGCSVNNTPSQISLHDNCLYPTVLIAPDSFNTGGSGIILKSEKVNDNLYRNIVLTCYHVYSPGMKVQVPAYNGREMFGYYGYKCARLKQSKEYDFCILLFETTDELPTVILDTQYEPHFSSEIIKIGCGLLAPPRLDYGQITSTNYVNEINGLKSYRTNATTIIGDSGGGCYDRNTYKLIGILDAIVTPMQPPLMSNIGLITPITYLLDWNKELDNELDYALKSDVKIPISLEVAKTNENKESVKDIHDIIEMLLEQHLLPEPEPQLNEPEVAPPPPEN